MSIVGEIVPVHIDIVDIKVAYPDVKSGDDSWDAPAGLTILEYKAVERYRYGRTSYEFSVVGDNAVFLDDGAVAARFQRVFDYIQQTGNESYRGRVEELKRDAMRVARMTINTNSKLKVHWECKHDGNDFDRKGGALGLSAEVKLIRGLLPTNIDRVIDALIEAIKRGVGPQNINLEV